MSAARNRPKKRHPKGRHVPRTRRFIRAEPLEPRIVLDGSGLGVISPDFIPTISINDDGLVRNMSVEIVRNNSASKFDENFGTSGGPSWILDLDLNFNRFLFAEVRDGLVTGSNGITLLEPSDSFTRVSDQIEFDLIGEGTVLAIPTPIVDDITLDADDHRMTYGQDAYGDTSFTLGQVVTDADFDSLDSQAGLEDPRPLSDGTESSRVTNNTLLRDQAESRGLEVRLANRGAAERIEDPGLISLPAPAAGFLPVESSPVSPNLGSLAKTDPAGSAEVSARHEREEFAATGSSGESSESDRAVALSRDRYFASHQARQPVAWSTQSGASEVRQYVYPEPHHESYAVNQTPRVRAASVASPAMFGLAASWRTASDASSQNRTTTQLLVFTAAVLPTPPQWQHWTADRQVSVGPHRDRPPSESAAPGAERSVRELLIAQYQPLSVLVGVSLVSAHLIADSRISRNRALALRRF